VSRSWTVTPRGVPKKTRKPDEDCQRKSQTRFILASLLEDSNEESTQAFAFQENR